MQVEPARRGRLFPHPYVVRQGIAPAQIMAEPRPCPRLCPNVFARRRAHVGGLRQRDHPLPAPRLDSPAKAHNLARAAERACPSPASNAQKPTLREMGQEAHLTRYARLR
jgi:hypothetical protein